MRSTGTGSACSRATPEMFGNDPSEPARYAADLFERNGVRRVLELGGGQGRDSLFLAARGFNVHVLDYAHAGVEVIQAKASKAGLANHLTVAQHDVRMSADAERADRRNVNSRIG